MSLPLPGHSIPYALTQSEINDFLDRNKANATLQNYLQTWEPVYGVIVHEDYGELLVWIDASAVLHVIDITNMSIVTEIEKAPYQSPDSGFINNLVTDIGKVVDQATTTAFPVALIVAAVLAVLWLKPGR